jgi:hypothetical protein
MEFVVRFVQLLLVLLTVLVAGAFLMALGFQDTGLLEKVVLVMVAALCMWGTITLPRLATRLRMRRHMS